MIESLSIAVHAFVSRVSMSFSVDETLLAYFYKVVMDIQTLHYFCNIHTPDDNPRLGRKY